MKSANMPITIIQPRPTPQFISRDDGASSDSDSEDSPGGGVDLDLEGDISMTTGRPSKRAKYSDDIVTPGEVITDDTQFMRYAHFVAALPSYHPPTPSLTTYPPTC